jgi:CBS domain-containing protein
MKVRDIIKTKGAGVNTTIPHNTIRNAIRTMVENRVGSLVVIDASHAPVGIITEQDIVKLVYEKENQDWPSMAVFEVMTQDILIGLLDDDVEYIMKLMTSNRIRHVPIIEDRRLAGIVSIGDIVKSLLADLKTENRHLSDYISGKYPA